MFKYPFSNRTILKSNTILLVKVRHKDLWFHLIWLILKIEFKESLSKESVKWSSSNPIITIIWWTFMSKSVRTHRSNQNTLKSSLTIIKITLTLKIQVQHYNKKNSHFILVANQIRSFPLPSHQRKNASFCQQTLFYSNDISLFLGQKSYHLLSTANNKFYLIGSPSMTNLINALCIYWLENCLQDIVPITLESFQQS